MGVSNFVAINKTVFNKGKDLVREFTSASVSKKFWHVHMSVFVDLCISAITIISDRTSSNILHHQHGDQSYHIFFHINNFRPLISSFPSSAII